MSAHLLEDIFKGATRPPMLAGVPMLPLMGLVGLTLLVFFWVGTLVSYLSASLSLIIAVPIYVWMRMVSKQDDQRLSQLMLRAKLALMNPNRSFWKARSYVPVVWRGTRNTFRR